LNPIEKIVHAKPKTAYDSLKSSLFTKSEQSSHNYIDTIIKDASEEGHESNSSSPDINDDC